MKMFEGKCPECGKKIFLPAKDVTGFCSRVCETNWTYRSSRMKPLRNK